MMETVHYDMMVASHRSRLENTSEDWSSLLASLRELTEWVSSDYHPTMRTHRVGG